MDLCTLWRKVVEMREDDLATIGLIEEAGPQNLARHLEGCEQCLNLLETADCKPIWVILAILYTLSDTFTHLTDETPTLSPEELLTTEEIMKSQEEDEREIREAVTSLITAYPSLAPEKYGLPDVADPASDIILYYLSWSGIKSLARRLADDCVNETVERFTIGEDGSLLIPGTFKNDAEAQETISAMHLTTDTGVVRLDPQYVQSEIRFMSDGEIGPEDAQRMALWLRDVLKLHPKLSEVNGEDLDKWKVDNENKPQ